MDRVTLDRNKRKLGKALKVQQRRHNEEQKEMDSESYFFVGQSQDIKSSLSKTIKAADFEPPQSASERRALLEFGKKVFLFW